MSEDILLTTEELERLRDEEHRLAEEFSRIKSQLAEARRKLYAAEILAEVRGSPTEKETEG